MLVRGSSPPAAKNPVCSLLSVVSFQTRRGTFQPRLAGSLAGRGQKKRLPSFYTEVNCRRVLVVGGGSPFLHPKFHLHLGTCSFISNATLYISNVTWYISTVFGGKLNRPGQAETLSALSYGGKLRTRVGRWGRPPTKNPICALVLVGAFQARPRTFPTQPGTFGGQLTGSSRGRGEEKRFPPFHTEERCGGVLVGGGPHKTSDFPRPDTEVHFKRVVERSGARFFEMYLKRTKAKKTDRNETRLGSSQ